MRVLMVTRGVVPISPRAGGAELVAYQLAKAMGRSAHEVVLVSDVTHPEFFAAPRVSFRPVGSRALPLVQKLPAGFFRWIVEHLLGNLCAARAAKRILSVDPDFDLVHVHGPLAALLICRFANVPVVYTEHDATPWICRYRHWWERPIRKLIYRAVNVRALERADHVATVFDSLREELVGRYGIPAERVTTIANGTDVDVFNPYRPGISPVRELHGFDRYILFVGRLTSRKAPDLLLRALVDTPGVNCAFVGDGPMRRKLEQLAGELALADRVAFLGNVAPTELGRVYADADFTVLPSVSEGMPLTVIESMACGTPVLTTRVAGATHLIDDWETGFLVKPDDLGQLEMAIRFLWGDAELREEMGRKARQKAIRDYVWPGVARQYLALYGSMLRGGLDARTHEVVEGVPSLQA
jgi:glycosyltransferase involved in cell wall biosynthesis